MTNALITAVQSMQNDLQYIDTISQNMVNMATPGYKRSIPLTQAFGDAMRIAGTAGSTSASPSTASFGGLTTAVSSANAFSSLTPTLTTMLDLSAGAVKQTGRPWDLAITGDGYFELATPEGTAYTRAGDFHLDGSGRLVSVGGFAVQGQSGDIVLSGNNATVDHTGNVMQDGATVAQIKIVQFKDGKAMQKTPAGFLRPGTATGSVADMPELQVGYLESSNVTPLREMIAMMETTRHFEAAQKLFQGYDEMLRTAIQKLGEF
jgi:flagellar basal-body rod protein FlgG